MRTRLRSYLCTFDIADAISESIISNFLPYPTKYKILQFDNFLIDSCYFYSFHMHVFILNRLSITTIDNFY